MSEKKVNQLAFPTRIENRSDKTILGHEDEAIPAGSVTFYSGMTLRDYFAAKFMQGFIAAPDLEENYSHVTKADCAKRAYEMADAMLAERAK